MREKCYNSRTSDDIDLKFAPFTKLDKRNKATQKNDDDVMSGNCDATVVFSISCQFGAMRNPDFGGIVCKT